MLRTLKYLVCFLFGSLFGVTFMVAMFSVLYSKDSDFSDAIDAYLKTL